MSKSRMISAIVDSIAGHPPRNANSILSRIIRG
jgi:hypothetical protein